MRHLLYYIYVIECVFVIKNCPQVKKGDLENNIVLIYQKKCDLEHISSRSFAFTNVFLLNSRDLSVSKGTKVSLQPHLFPEWDGYEQVKLLL